METRNDWDVIVIGGGPAGMMAAGRAAERGAKVLLLEKNAEVGKKLLITGGGRCNVTNAEPDLRTLLRHYTTSGKYLFSPFSQFDNVKTRAWFAARGMPTKIEDRQRVFPASDSAASVLKVLTDYLAQYQVTIFTYAAVANIQATGSHIAGLTLKDGRALAADSYIIATGGTSRPDTGSTGDGFGWLTKLGHAVKEPDPSLVPITLADDWVSALAGLTLPDVKITVWQDEERQRTQSGRLLFTHFGLSGPTILHMSKTIGDLLTYSPVTLTIDCFPTLDHGTLDTQLATLFSTHSNKNLGNALGELIPHRLAEGILAQLHLAATTKCHSVTREDRRRLMHTLKQLPFSVSGRLGVEKAIVTSGGVSLHEVNTKNMQSRLINNLFLVGDILDIDRPSGGYSLQLCWTTGYVAGSQVPLSSQTRLEESGTVL